MKTDSLTKPMLSSKRRLSLGSFIVCCALAPLFFLDASSWDECHYQAKVKSSTETEIVLLIEKHIGGDGMGGDPGSKYCNQHLGKLELAKSELQEDLKLLSEGRRVKVSRMNYSAMGPEGPVGGLSWRLLPQQD